MSTTKYSLGNFRKLPVSNPDAISKVNLFPDEVLETAEDIRIRRTNLDKALSLKSSKIYKTAIVIKSKEGLIRTDSGISGIKDEIVYTDSGLQVPLKCIYSIDFFE